jgi:xyloglucan-specific exo-beta-1,4-glucanase
MKNKILPGLVLLILPIFGISQVNWQNASTLGMGYVDGLIIHPKNNSKYVRTDVGGVFKYDGAAQQWNNLFDDLVTIGQNDIASVESFALDLNTTDANQVIYALSGNGVKSFMLKSVNDGASWSINQGWFSDSIKVFGNGDWRCAGERLMIDPKNNGVVYCGTRFNGLWKTTNAGVNWNKVQSFTAVGGGGGLPVNGGISFVAIDSSSTTTVNAVTVSKNIYVGLIDGGIYRTNNGGSSWCFLSGGFDTTKYNPVRAIFVNGKLMVASMEDGDRYTDGEIWEFTPDVNNCSGSWRNKTPGLGNAFDCPAFGKYMFNALAQRPGQSNSLYLGIRGNTPRKIFYTENINADQPTWKIITLDGSAGYSNCSAAYTPAVFTAPSSWVNTAGYDWVGNMEFDQQDGKKLWFTSGNGVIEVEDVTAGTVKITGNNIMKGLEILCVNDIAAPPLPNNTPVVTGSMDVLGVVYGDLTTGKLRKLDTSFGLGAGISLSYSAKNPNTMALIGQDYFDPVNLNRKIRSTDGGQTWKSIYNKLPDCNDAPWGGNIALSATDPNNLVWVPNAFSYISSCAQPVKNFPRFTKDGGASWTTCTDIAFAEGNFPFLNNATFSVGKSLESDKVNGSKFYYYAMPGYTFVPQLWRTSNGGASWQKMSEGLMPITGGGQLKANPIKEDDIWFAPYNGYIEDNDPNPDLRKLWHSADGGVSWTTLTAIDEVYAFGFGQRTKGTTDASLVVYGKKQNVESIFVSYDLGKSFTDLGTKNIPEGIVGNIEGDFKIAGRVYAATGCRGLWYGDIPGFVAADTTIVVPPRQKFTVYPNPATSFFKIALPEDASSFTNGYLLLIDMNGRVVKKVAIASKDQEIKVSGLQRGVYTVKAILDKQVYFARLLLQ